MAATLLQMLLLLALSVLLLPLLMNGGLHDQGPVVWLSHGGALRGTWSRTAGGRRFQSFQGIPYAQPPTGGRRFASRLPSPALAWSWLLHLPRLLSVLLKGALQQREDCLFVNVYTPEAPDTDKNASLAVLVWLHGGAFLIGDGSAEEYGPDMFLEHDVTVVTLNYRLGVLGFLYGGPDSGAPGNAGLRDQALALRWVRDNIAAFGGDPGRVTLWGESAGAVSAHLHTLAAGSGGRDLFQRLILSSGVAVLPWALQGRPLDGLHALVDGLGQGWRDRRRPERPRDLVRFLKKVPVEQLVAASSTLKSVTSFPGNGMRLLQWLPVVEELPADPEFPRFLAQSPLTTLAEGTFRSVPTILGVNSREGLAWLAGKGSRQVPRLLQRLQQNFSLVVDDLPFLPERGRDDAGRARGPSAVQVRRAELLIRSCFFGRQAISMRTLPSFLDLYSDLIFNIAVREATALHLRWATTPLFLYRFSFDGRLGFLKRMIGTTVSGVGHADELGYLFNMKVLPPVALTEDSPESLTRRRLISLWASFIKHGQPTSDLDSIMWEPASEENGIYLDIAANLSLRKQMFEQRMKFWSDLYRDVFERPLSW